MHTFLHSCAHRFGLQRFESTIAIRVILSAIATDGKIQEDGAENGAQNTVLDLSAPPVPRNLGSRGLLQLEDRDWLAGRKAATDHTRP